MRTLVHAFVGLVVACGSMVGMAADPADAPNTKSALRRWQSEYAFDRFQVHCDFELEQPEQLAGLLRQFETELREKLPGTVHEAAVHVVIFQQENEYRRYMQHYFPQAPARRAIFIQDRGPALLFTFWHPEVMTDLRHEGTHALINHGRQPLPLWLDEGLAEFFETPEEEQGQSIRNALQLAVIIDQLQLQATQGTQLSAKTTPATTLMDLERVAGLDDFTDYHYLVAWSWMHFLMHHSPATRQLVNDQLQCYARGESPPPISRLLRELLPDAETHYRAHLAQLSSNQ